MKLRDVRNVHKSPRILLLAVPLLEVLLLILAYTGFFSLYVPAASASISGMYATTRTHTTLLLQQKLVLQGLLENVVFYEHYDDGIGADVLKKLGVNVTTDLLMPLIGRTLQSYWSFMREEYNREKTRSGDYYYRKRIDYQGYEHRFEDDKDMDGDMASLSISIFDKQFLISLRTFSIDIDEYAPLVEERNNNSISQDHSEELMKSLREGCYTLLSNMLEKDISTSILRNYEQTLDADSSTRKVHTTVTIVLLSLMLLVLIASMGYFTYRYDKNLKRIYDTYCYMTQAEVSYLISYLNNKKMFFSIGLADDQVLLTKCMSNTAGSNTTSTRDDIFETKEVKKGGKEKTTRIRNKRIDNNILSTSSKCTIVYHTLTVMLILVLLLLGYLAYGTVLNTFVYTRAYLQHMVLMHRLMDAFTHLNIFVLFGNYFNIAGTSGDISYLDSLAIQSFNDYWTSNVKLQADLYGTSWTGLSNFMTSNACSSTEIDSISASLRYTTCVQEYKKYTDKGFVFLLNQYQVQANNMLENIKRTLPDFASQSRFRVTGAADAYFFASEYAIMRMQVLNGMQAFASICTGAHETIQEEQDATNQTRNRTLMVLVSVILLMHAAAGYACTAAKVSDDVAYAYETFRIIHPLIIANNTYVANRYKLYF